MNVLDIFLLLTLKNTPLGKLEVMNIHNHLALFSVWLLYHGDKKKLTNNWPLVTFSAKTSGRAQANS